MSNSNKKQIIKDIQQLLNEYKGSTFTQINPTLLEYMSENELKMIIDDLLTQKEQFLETNLEWLNRFKKENPLEN